MDSAIKGGQSRSMQDTKSIKDTVDMSLIPLPSPHRPKKRGIQEKAIISQKHGITKTFPVVLNIIPIANHLECVSV